MNTFVNVVEKFIKVKIYYFIHKISILYYIVLQVKNILLFKNNRIIFKKLNYNNIVMHMIININKSINNIFMIKLSIMFKKI